MGRVYQYVPLEMEKVTPKPWIAKSLDACTTLIESCRVTSNYDEWRLSYRSVGAPLVLSTVVQV
jgi:hypothetical protein